MNTATDTPTHPGRAIRRAAAVVLTAGLVTGLVACATNTTPLPRTASLTSVNPLGDTHLPADRMVEAIARIQGPHRASPIEGTRAAYRAMPERYAGLPADRIEEAALRDQAK